MEHHEYNGNWEGLRRLINLVLDGTKTQTRSSFWFFCSHSYSILKHRRGFWLTFAALRMRASLSTSYAAFSFFWCSLPLRWFVPSKARHIVEPLGKISRGSTIWHTLACTAIHNGVNFSCRFLGVLSFWDILVLYLKRLHFLSKLTDE